MLYQDKIHNNGVSRLPYRLFMLGVLVLVGLTACADFNNNLNGNKLEPPRPLSDMVLVDVHQQALPANFLRQKWSYVIFADSDCDATCQEQIDLTRQSRNTLKQADRVQRLLVLGYEPEKNWVHETEAQNEDLVIAVLTRPIWSIFTVQFQSAIEEIGGMPFFLVNENALIIVAYDDLVSAQNVQQDLVKLLQ